MQQGEHISEETAARRTGLETNTVRRSVGLVSSSLTEDGLAKVRRARRLTELGVNPVGAGIIVRMRRRIVEPQIPLQRTEQQRRRR